MPIRSGSHPDRIAAVIRLSIRGADRALFHFLLDEGKNRQIVVTSPYLVSAGQQITLSVVARNVPDVRPPGPELTNATHLRDETEAPLVDVPVVWDVSFLPTRRLLADILADVVTHERDYPTHGTDCICMDKFSREIRLQVSKSLPPDDRTTDSDWSGPALRERLGSKSRIKHVLNMVLRGL